jgi:hypothetical protein
MFKGKDIDFRNNCDALNGLLEKKDELASSRLLKHTAVVHTPCSSSPE